MSDGIVQLLIVLLIYPSSIQVFHFPLLALRLPGPLPLLAKLLASLPLSTAKIPCPPIASHPAPLVRTLAFGSLSSCPPRPAPSCWTPLPSSRCRQTPMHLPMFPTIMYPPCASTAVLSPHPACHLLLFSLPLSTVGHRSSPSPLLCWPLCIPPTHHWDPPIRPEPST